MGAFKCPDASLSNSPAAAGSVPNNNTIHMAYMACTDANSGANANAGFDGYSNPSVAGANLSVFTAPAETLFVGEPQDKAGGIWGYAMSPAGVGYCGTNCAGNLHNGQTSANYLLVDGHVKAYRPDQIAANSNYLWLRKKP